MVTNAFCLTFGYNFLSYKQEDLDDGKRPRMLCEMGDGGLGKSNEFAYDLFELDQEPHNPAQ